MAQFRRRTHPGCVGPSSPHIDGGRCACQQPISARKPEILTVSGKKEKASSRLKNVSGYTGRDRSRRDRCATPRVALTTASRTGACLIIFPTTRTASSSVTPDIRTHRSMNSVFSARSTNSALVSYQPLSSLLPAATRLIRPTTVPFSRLFLPYQIQEIFASALQRLRAGSNCSSMDSIRFNVRRSISASPAWRVCSA